MNKLTCIESYVDNNRNSYGCFLIEPLEIGQGLTLGNTFRRTLLSDLTGFSITGVRINNLKHEFATIEGLREDTLEVLLNLKEIIFKTKLNSNNNQLKLTGFLNIKGPKIVTAGLFNLPKETLKILNPNQYICTIVDNSELYLEIDIENGKGYRLTEDINQTYSTQKTPVQTKGPITLSVDAIFMPVKKVNYKIKLISDTKGNIKESLSLEVWTNGSLTPQRSMQESLKILINLFYPLFINSNMLSFSSELSKKFYEQSLNKTN
jgi:DNA-directed RNA polymerase subunit alpha